MPHEGYKKSLYHGIFNWHGQDMEVWRYSYSAAHFMFESSIELANQLGTVSPRTVRQYFDGTRDNYLVERVKKKKKSIKEGEAK